jgi:hypothetical protein
VIATGSVVVAASLWSGGAPAEPTLRAAAFQVISIGSTTGYASADYELWPGLAQLVLIHFMILGGMAGSTSGGVKTMRALLALRALGSALAHLGHARAVPRPVLYGKGPVSNQALAGVFAFLALYLLIASLAAAWVAAAGYDLDTAISCALSALGNVGPALGEAGPSDNYAHFPVPVKLALAESASGATDRLAPEHSYGDQEAGQEADRPQCPPDTPVETPARRRGAVSLLTAGDGRRVTLHCLLRSRGEPRRFGGLPRGLCGCGDELLRLRLERDAQGRGERFPLRSRDCELDARYGEVERRFVELFEARQEPLDLGRFVGRDALRATSGQQRQEAIQIPDRGLAHDNSPAFSSAA